MRIVLYDDDLEPLTVLEIPHWRSLNSRMPEGANIRVPVFRPVPVGPIEPVNDPITDLTGWVVTIRFETLVRQGRKHWLAITSDAESALLLRAAFLPGQQGRVQERERAAFVAGVRTAFKVLE